MSQDIKNLTVRQRNLLYSLYLLNKENAYLDATTLQKFMFLVTKNFPEKFVDYNQDYEAFDFGPYSEAVEQDASRLQNLGILDDKLNITAENYELVQQIENSSKEIKMQLNEYIKGLGDLKRDDLIYLVYKLYPEYTKISRIAGKVRSENYEFLEIPLEALKKKKEIMITTDKHNIIGVKLVKNEIRVFIPDEQRLKPNGN